MLKKTSQAGQFFLGYLLFPQKLQVFRPGLAATMKSFSSSAPPVAAHYTGVAYLSYSSEFFCAKSEVVTWSHAVFKIKDRSSRSRYLIKLMKVLI